MGEEEERNNRVYIGQYVHHQMCDMTWNTFQHMVEEKCIPPYITGNDCTKKHIKEQVELAFGPNLGLWLFALTWAKPNKKIFLEGTSGGLNCQEILIYTSSVGPTCSHFYSLDQGQQSFIETSVLIV
jgi:hypothetical protein